MNGGDPCGSSSFGVGAEWPFRRVEPLREAELEDSSSGSQCNTPHENISRRWCDFLPLRSRRYLPCTSFWSLSRDFSSSWTPFA